MPKAPHLGCPTKMYSPEYGYVFPGFRLPFCGIHAAFKGISRVLGRSRVLVGASLQQHQNDVLTLGRQAMG